VASVLSVASWTVWVAFAVDFMVRLLLAEDRWPYAVRHWYDVALIALPMLRPLRLLRLLALARILNRSGKHAVRLDSNALGEMALDERALR
jgi:voltage-gated potassium channel